MDEDGLPIVGTGIDYTKVKPLDKKRLLAFINHFVSHTVQFLNHFAGVCEEKMAKIESQLYRMEVTMNILEAKLSSIPGMDDIKLSDEQTSGQPADGAAQSAAQSQPPQTEAGQQAPPSGSGPPAPPQQQPAEQPPVPAPVEVDVPKVSKDPRYIKFFKMLNMGVPPPAIKIKMSAEGFNPNLLDTPDAPAPPGGEADQGDSSDSEDAFTDSD